MLGSGNAMAVVAALGLFAGYWRALHRRIDFPADLFLSACAVVGMLVLVASLRNVLVRPADLAALERAEKGLPLVDGRREAVRGTILPAGDPVLAPFSGVPCVAYEYCVAKPDRANDEGETVATGSAIAGLALAPAVIRSERGDVRLLGLGTLEEFPRRRFSRDAEALRRAEEFVARTEFRPSGLEDPGRLFSPVEELAADADGSLRRDWRYVKPGEIPLRTSPLEERLVRPGETVTALGLWDAARGGLVTSASSRTVALAPGGPEKRIASLRERPWGVLAFALAWTVAFHAGILMVLLKGS